MSIDYCDNWRSRVGKDNVPLVRVLEIKDKDRPERIRCRLLVVREETRAEHSATISLSYFSLDQPRGGFHNHRFQGRWEGIPGGIGRVSVTGGSVMLNGDGIPRGAHIGTYLLDEVVRWAKQWPTAVVRRISLSSVDGSEINGERRNRLYEQFGITFAFSADRSSGVSTELMVAADLTPVDPKVWAADISEFGLVEYLRSATLSVKDLTYANERLEQARSKLGDQLRAAEEKPVCWAFHRVWLRHNLSLLLIFIVTAVVVLKHVFSGN